MAVNRGKNFEDKIREAFKKVPSTSVLRLIDPQNGYAGVRNICDFIIYNYPNQYFIECKSCHGNTLPFSNITDNQWSGLIEQSEIKGVKAGYMIWFIDNGITVYISAEEMFLHRQNHKSVNIKDLCDIKHIDLVGKKKRVFFEYDMNKFFEEIKNEDKSI